jgi:hypothetical protein
MTDTVLAILISVVISYSIYKIPHSHIQNKKNEKIKILIKNRRANLPPNPVALLAMLLLLLAIPIHYYLYPNAFPYNIATPPNIWDWAFMIVFAISSIVVLVNVVYSFCESLKYGGP